MEGRGTNRGPKVTTLMFMVDALWLSFTPPSFPPYQGREAMASAFAVPRPSLGLPTCRKARSLLGEILEGRIKRPKGTPPAQVGASCFRAVRFPLAREWRGEGPEMVAGTSVKPGNDEDTCLAEMTPVEDSGRS